MHEIKKIYSCNFKYTARLSHIKTRPRLFNVIQFYQRLRLATQFFSHTILWYFLSKFGFLNRLSRFVLFWYLLSLVVFFPTKICIQVIGVRTLTKASRYAQIQLMCVNVKLSTWSSLGFWVTMLIRFNPHYLRIFTCSNFYPLTRQTFFRFSGIHLLSI